MSQYITIPLWEQHMATALCAAVTVYIVGSCLVTVFRCYYKTYLTKVKVSSQWWRDKRSNDSRQRHYSRPLTIRTVDAKWHEFLRYLRHFWFFKVQHPGCIGYSEELAPDGTPTHRQYYYR